MKIIICILLSTVLNTNLVQGQKTSQPDESVFRNRMTIVVDVDSVKVIEMEIAAMLDNKTKPDNTKITFDLKSDWTLQFQHGFDWTELHPHQGKTINSYAIAKDEIRIKGDEIFAIFEIDSEKFPLNIIPLVKARGCLYNGEWTATIINDCLIIRYVHSYPDGNQTSWYREKSYYFKKY